MTNEPTGLSATVSRRDIFSIVAITCAIVALAFSVGAFVLASSASTDADEAVHRVENMPAVSGSAGEDHAADSAMPMDESSADAHEAFAFGEAADASDAARTIEIEAVDVAFKPTAIDVAQGETILFEIHNSGAAVHDFTIGDAKTQNAHDREMAKMKDPTMGSHGDGNAVVIEPGKTAELAFTFTTAGEFIFGCHIPGHYAAGMRGTITVAA